MLRSRKFFPNIRIANTGLERRPNDMSSPSVDNVENIARQHISPEHIVGVLYRAVLRRPPDEGGLAFYSSLLRAGRSELEVVSQLLNSAEFAANRLVSVSECRPATLDKYDPRADERILQWLTDGVRSMTDHLRRPTWDYDAFHSAALTEIENLSEATNDDFAKSQQDYLEFHRDRFHELLCVVNNVLELSVGSSVILDFGLSINSFIMRRLFPAVKVAVADRPQVREVQDAKHCFDAVYTVDLLDDQLDRLDLATRFDLIVFSEVIEHLQVHPSRVIAFLLKHLRDRGHVILTTPNLFSHAKLHQISQRKSPLLPFPADYTQAHAPHFHFREYSMGDMLSMIDAGGGRTTAFFFSGCWDEPAMRAVIPTHELGNMFLVFQKKG
jgi:SAM-dependent methyltransferase